MVMTTLLRRPISSQSQLRLFGNVHETDVILNEAGTVIESWWHSIPTRFPDVMLDAMVVMPNHVHGILSLGTDPDVSCEARSLSDIVGWFKTRTVRDHGLGVRSRAWRGYDGKLWQSGYYDHVIRTDAALSTIRAYIEGNPSRWVEDRENPALPRIIP